MIKNETILIFLSLKSSLIHFTIMKVKKSLKNRRTILIKFRDSECRNSEFSYLKDAFDPFSRCHYSGGQNPRKSAGQSQLKGIQFRATSGSTNQSFAQIITEKTKSKNRSYTHQWSSHACKKKFIKKPKSFSWELSRLERSLIGSEGAVDALIFSCHSSVVVIQSFVYFSFSQCIKKSKKWSKNDLK